MTLITASCMLISLTFSEGEREKQREGMSRLYNNVGCDFFSSRKIHTHPLAVQGNWNAAVGINTWFGHKREPE